MDGVYHSVTYRRTPGTRIGLRCSTHCSWLHERSQDTTPPAIHFDLSTPLSRCKLFSACRNIARSPSLATHALALCFTHSQLKVICSKPSIRARLENNHRPFRYLSTQIPMKEVCEVGFSSYSHRGNDTPKQCFCIMLTTTNTPTI